MKTIQFQFCVFSVILILSSQFSSADKDTGSFYNKIQRIKKKGKEGMLTRAQIRHDDGKSKRERDQSQNEFGEDLRLRSQKQAQSKGGMSQSQTQSQLRMDDIKASAEFQNQKQRLQNFGRQAQSQTHFNLGEGKGKKYESSSRNDMREGGQQQQDQTQTFDTSFYDEQSESNSEELGAVQKQAQTKGFKLEGEAPLANFNFLNGEVTEEGVIIQVQRQWEGGSFSYTKLIPFDELDQFAK